GGHAGAEEIVHYDRRVADAHAVHVGNRVQRARRVDAGRDPEITCARLGALRRRDDDDQERNGRKDREELNPTKSLWALRALRSIEVEEDASARHARSAATCAAS